jgi:methylated-DNA-[protein]-cysteine S-methyltransferase
MEYTQKIESPLGILTLSSDGQNICGLWMEGQKYFARTMEQDAADQDMPVFAKVRKWLALYFSGREPDFMPPLMPRGSPFQKAIWNMLRKIPYGQTTTYGELARQFALENDGSCTSPRAVGGAVGRNPISILIPCHRVLGKNGGLAGYAGGIGKKMKLLRLEGVRVGNNSI